MLAGVVVLANPFKARIWPPCPLHALTGLYCPFCGGTRAAWAAAHGNLGLMFHENALFPLVAFGLAWWWLASLGKATGRWRLPFPSGKVFNVVVVVVLVGFALLRNLPGFGALAPPAVA